MPLIPDYQPLQRGSYRPSVASPGIAGAPALATADAVKEVAKSVGGVLLDVRKQYQSVRDNGAKNQARVLFQKANAEHLEYRMKNPDESTWEKDLSTRLTQTREDIFKQEMSPEMRQEMEAEFAGWNQQAISKTSLDATSQGVKRARQQNLNAVNAYRESGDFDSARKVVNEGVAAGVWLPEEAQADILDIDKDAKDWTKKEANKVTLGTITEDAAGWMAEHPVDKLPEGVDPVTYSNQQGFAREQLRGITHDDTATIMDGMAKGEVTTPEKIDELGFRLRPAVREELKQELVRRADAQEKARRSTPEYQNQAIGRASALISDWKRDGEGFDAGYAKIYSLVDQVEDPGAKKALLDQLGEASTGQRKTLDTNLKVADDALLEAYKGNRFGDVSLTGKATMSLRAALDDGLLTDQGKLQRAGFTPDQAKTIASAKKPSEREELFRTMFSDRKNVDTLTTFERAAYLAVRDGKGPSSMIEIEDPESMDAAITARTQADEKLGAAKKRMQEFARANPDASKKEYEDEIYRIAGEETRKRMQQTMITPKPGSGFEASGPPGASNSTPIVPVGRNLVEVVKGFEAGGAADGYFPKAYWDYGQWSIGYGTKAKEGEQITKAEAEKRLGEELSFHETRVRDYAEKVGLALKPHELDALTSFDFNTGELERLLRDPATGGLRSKAEIAEKMLLYRNADGQRLKGLENRRAAERELFLNGYSH